MLLCFTAALLSLCCSVLPCVQCVAVMLNVAVCYRRVTHCVLQCVAVCYRVLQCVTACCSMLHRCITLHVSQLLRNPHCTPPPCCSGVAAVWLCVCCSIRNIYGAVPPLCCSVLQRVAVCRSWLAVYVLQFPQHPRRNAPASLCQLVALLPGRNLQKSAHSQMYSNVHKITAHLTFWKNMYI